ncbi:hypothetical protein N566_26045 [Streptomycetaceae bacterium MP113-05]|nr:hypothetical protein N566_26045 [Streptomycetaceae bacterium MP113-05]
MAAERHVDETELMDVAQDPEQARRLHKALRTISGSSSLDGPLREMAQKVLRGDIGMMDAIETEKYTDAVYDRLRAMRRAAEDQTHADRQAARGEFTRWQEKQEAEDAREQAERDAPTHLHGDSGRRGTVSPPRHR